VHVTLDLIFQGQRIPLAQVAHNFAILQEPMDLPSGEGEIVMSIDGSVTRIPISLPVGCQAPTKRFPIGSIEPSSA
jgi:hypothetical protein